MIYDADPAAFKKIDRSGAIKTALSKDWTATHWKPTAEQKKTLIALITSDAGKKCQDELFAKHMETFIADCEKLYTKDVKAIMMYCEIRHLGGAGPVKRIFDRISGTITLDKIMASLVKDQMDTSSSNQVGDVRYWTRHLKCREFIDQYAIEDDEEGLLDEEESEETDDWPDDLIEDEEESEDEEMGITATQVLDVYRSWIGLSRAAGTHSVILDIYNKYIRSHPGSGRGYIVQRGDAYCDTTFSAAFIKLGAVDLIGGVECGVEEHVKIFKRAGIWEENGSVTPKPGYGIIYNWDDPSQPNDGYSDHIGIVEKVSGGYITCIEGNISGGVVGRRTIPVGWGYIRGYVKPKYASKAASGKKTQVAPTAINEAVKPAATNKGACSVELKWFVKGAVDPQVAKIQLILNHHGYKGKNGLPLEVDGELGVQTMYAIETLQREKGFPGTTNWGTVAAKTWQAIMDL